MKVVLYSYPHFLDHVFPQVEALSKIAEVQVVIELAPESWNSTIFDLPRRKLKSGLYEAFEILGHNFPETVSDYWKKCSSFHFYVFDNRRSLHPSTWRQAWILTEYLRRSKADIIHFDGISLRIAPFLWRLKRFPIVLNIHDAEPHSGEDNWRNRLSTVLTKKYIDHYIFHSKFCNNEFISRTDVQPSRTSMIPFGVIDIFRHWMMSIEKEVENNVLFFGRLSPYKGLEVFLNAASIVAQRIENCTFVIAGKPIPNYTIPSLPALPKSSTFTIQTEYITNSQLCKLMEKASIVVCPYIDASQSGVILTAFAFNKPVVVTNVGGLSEYVEDGVTGRIIQPKDPQALANAIISLLSSISMRRHMSENIAGLRETKLSWTNSAHETMRIYERVVNEKNEGN